MTDSGSGSEVEIDVDAEASSDRPGGDGADRDGRDGDDAQRLADELGRTDLRTTDEGYVEARVTRLEEADETTVRLVVRLPTGSEVPFLLEKPVPWSDEFLLARIVEWVGYDAATVDHLVGERILVDRTRPARDGPPRTARPEDAVRSPTYEAVLSALGLSARGRESPEWRLVDPADLEGEDAAGVAVGTKLLLATTATALALASIAAAGMAVPGVAAWFLLSMLAGLVLMVFVLYAVLVIVGSA